MAPPLPTRRAAWPAGRPAPEPWLPALPGLDGRLTAAPADLSALAQALAPWEDVGTGQTGPARATFRLTEVPAEPDDGLFGADDDEPGAAGGGSGGAAGGPGGAARGPGGAARRAGGAARGPRGGAGRARG